MVGGKTYKYNVYIYIWVFICVYINICESYIHIFPRNCGSFNSSFFWFLETTSILEEAGENV